MRRRAVIVLAFVAMQAHAAGGHHAVDDAVILGPGECELETWITRAREPRTNWHLGPGCRVGEVELSATLDGTPRAGVGSVQAKMAWAGPGGWSFGAALAPEWHRAGGSAPHSTLVLALATWTEGAWTAHFNAGRDFVRSGPDHARHGVAVEWAANADWSFVAERFLERGTHQARAGVRWQGGRTWNVDLSHARALRDAQGGRWTLGVTFGFPPAPR